MFRFYHCRAMTFSHSFVFSRLLSVFLLLLVYSYASEAVGCKIPGVLRGRWLFYEANRMRSTEVNDLGVSTLGECTRLNGSTTFFQLLLRQDRCYRCLEVHVRTINVLQTRDSGCLSGATAAELDYACGSIDDSVQLNTWFSENFRPKICRSSIEGTWHFSYQRTDSSTGVCDLAGNTIRSCQNAGDQYPSANQRFEMNFEQCTNEDLSSGVGRGDLVEGVHEFFCLGEWSVGKNNYFAVVNTKESRLEERYRCFLRNLDNELVLGRSITPECSLLKTPENSPVTFFLQAVQTEAVVPSCYLPANLTGDWINTANLDADVTVNATHMVETYHPDVGRVRTTTYTCLERRGTLYMMARQHIVGCGTDYICFDILARHHNIMRYRRSREHTKPEFYKVCSWRQFIPRVVRHRRFHLQNWLYSVMIAKKLKTIPCPVAGMFRFEQRGQVPFRTRILNGLTEAPRPEIQCNGSLVAEFSACTRGQVQDTELLIDVQKCYRVDQQGLPQDIYSDPDYKMQCAGHWRENLRSYMITYDELDPISKYRCWVYLRTDINRIKMSQSVSSACSVRQTAESDEYLHGAAVALDLIENERESDWCPLNYDDGDNPWAGDNRYFTVFTFGTAPSHHLSLCVLTVCLWWSL